MASLRSFSQTQISDHSKAAQILGLIKDEFYFCIQKNKGISEGDGLDFIKRAYKRHGLVNDSKKEFAIVAFGKNTKEVHYFPKGKGVKLKPNTLILLDIWARLPSPAGSANGGQARLDKRNSPYADMTWMFWYGKKIPKDFLNKWKVLIKSRETAIDFVRENKLPKGLDIDRAAHDVIGNAGFGNAIKHTVGHSLGFDSPHGKLPGINWREYSSILKNVGYTIEPGMYFQNFGMRTEIDFYISKDNKIVITTPVQTQLTCVHHT